MPNLIPLRTFRQQVMHTQVGSPHHSDVKMDPGLSARMRVTLDALAANPPSGASHASGAASHTIDLSTAQNEVIRPELLEFFKTVVEDRITEQVGIMYSSQHHRKH